eukprot:gene32220-12784_t
MDGGAPVVRIGPDEAEAGAQRVCDGGRCGYETDGAEDAAGGGAAEPAEAAGLWSNGQHDTLELQGTCCPLLLAAAVATARVVAAAAAARRLMLFDDAARP